MEIILANGQMGISTLDRTTRYYNINSMKKFHHLQVFTKFWCHPICLNSLKAKKNRIFSVIKGADLFEFEPAFDEYLKAMESVKVGRESSNNKIVVLVDKESDGGCEKSKMWTRTNEGYNRKVGFGENGVGRSERGLGEEGEVDEGVEERRRNDEDMRGLEFGEGLLSRKGGVGRSRGWTRRENEMDFRNEKELGEGKVEESVDRLSRKRMNGGVASKLDGVGSRQGGRGNSKLEYRENEMDLRNGKELGEIEIDGNVKKPNRIWVNEAMQLQRTRKEGFSKKDGRGSNRGGSGYHKLEYRENEMDFSNEREVGETEVDGSVRRWTNGAVTSRSDAKERTKKDQRFQETSRRSNDVKRLGKDEDMHQGGSDEKRKYSDMHKRSLSLNATQVTTQFPNTDVTGISKWAPERQQSYRSSNGANRRSNSVKRLGSDEDTYEEGLDAKRKYTNMQKKPFNSNSTKVTTQVRKAERETDSTGISKWVPERQQSYRSNIGTYRLGSDEDMHGGGLDEKRKYTDMQKTPLNSNSTKPTTWVRNTERETDFTSINKWAPEREHTYRSGIGSKNTESSLNQTLIDWEEISRHGSGMEFGETESWKNSNIKELSRGNKFGKQNYDSDINIRSKRESSYVRPNGKVFDTEKHGLRSTKTEVELDRDHSHTDDTRRKVSRKGGNFTRGSNFLEDGDEDDMDMERAAFKSFEVFTDLRGQPRVLRMDMEERIQNLAKWLNGTDINLPEWLFSKMIHSARIRFSDHSILRVIQILGTLGNWKRVVQVIEWLQSRERFKSYKSRYIYTAALDVLGKAKRPVEALNVFHAMLHGVSSYPDLAAYHCIAVTLGQAGYMKELFDVIDIMRSPPQNKFNTGLIEKWDPRLEPDIIVYNAVLGACARRKQWEGAFWVLQQLKQQGLQPSSTTFGLAMEVMLACEKYNLVYEFFRKVEKSAIPNSLNYKVLVNTLWKEGKTDDAVVAVKDMERRGIVGSASLYYDLARCLCSAGRCDEALMQMDKICKVAHKPLVVTYTGLIQACLDAGNIQNGTYIFNQMQEFCSPNLVTCNIMLKAYLEHKMFEDAKDLLQKMLDGSCHIARASDYKNTVSPDSYTFNTMLDACAAEQKWDDFRYAFQEMLHRGFNFNTKRHLRMILEACRAGKGELLEMTWKHMVQANRTPPPPLVKEKFCLKLEKNDYTAAISSIASHPTNDTRLQAFSEKGWLDLLQANTDRIQMDSIIGLTHQLSNLVAGSDRPHTVLQNLLSSCKKLTRTHNIVAEINSTDVRDTYVS